MHPGRTFAADRADPHSQPPIIERFSPDKSPEALLIACTDPILDDSLLSRFRSAPVLVMRNAGPVVPPFGARCAKTEAAIDWAVAKLGVKEIVVCGHLPGSPLQALVDDEGCREAPADERCLFYAQATRRILQDKFGSLNREQLVRAVAEENALVQMANLRTHPAVLAGLARGQLTLHRWTYDADRDELLDCGPAPSKFLKRCNGPLQPVQRPLPCLDPCDIYLA